MSCRDSMSGAFALLRPLPEPESCGTVSQSLTYFTTVSVDMLSVNNRTHCFFPTFKIF